MNTIQAAQKAKAEKSLNVVVRYPEGIMTRKEWIELQFKNGSTVEESTKNKIDYNRTKFNRMNYKEQEEYLSKCYEKIPCYNLTMKDESFYHISKAEFDYFNSLKN